jgi:DNA repair ATPase RecN
MSKKVENILESFINNEIVSTEQRIAAIRAFVETLRTELATHAAKIPTDPADKKYITTVLKLFKEMIQTYEDEVKVLTLKREKMLEHLLNARSVATSLVPNSPEFNNLHIN